VELFQSQGVALAPLAARYRPRLPVDHDLTGTIALSGTTKHGLLTLSLDNGVYELFPSAPSHGMRHDSLRELTNQLAGRIKNRLLKFQVPLCLGLPSVTRQDAASRVVLSSDARGCVFRTRRGEVVVTLSGVDETALDYSSAIRVIQEDDLIAF
jgi:hypothetical protein